MFGDGSRRVRQRHFPAAERDELGAEGDVALMEW